MSEKEAPTGASVPCLSWLDELDIAIQHAEQAYEKIPHDLTAPGHVFLGILGAIDKMKRSRTHFTKITSNPCGQTPPTSGGAS